MSRSSTRPHLGIRKNQRNAEGHSPRYEDELRKWDENKTLEYEADRGVEWISADDLRIVINAKA